MSLAGIQMFSPKIYFGVFFRLAVVGKPALLALSLSK
jgi:hypothetical protein